MYLNKRLHKRLRFVPREEHISCGRILTNNQSKGKQNVVGQESLRRIQSLVLKYVPIKVLINIPLLFLYVMVVLKCHQLLYYTL